MRYEYDPPQLLKERTEPLRTILNQRGMVTYLAGELGLSRAAVSRWREIPERHIAPISKLLGISQRRLRGGRSL